jgi:hypothetical protein
LKEDIEGMIEKLKRLEKKKWYEEKKSRQKNLNIF